MLWCFHPDPGVDVAVLLISGAALKEQQVRYASFLDDSHVLTRSAAKDHGMSEGDRVYALGFPMGLVGERRNYVIVRQGCLARVRDALAGESQEFLIDASVFPGNSGGPVVTCPDLASIQGTHAPDSANLIGIITSYLPYQDVAVSRQTLRPRVVFDENSGLAAVTPYDFIAETIAEREKSFAATTTRVVETPIVESPAPPEDVSTPPPILPTRLPVATGERAASTGYLLLPPGSLGIAGDQGRRGSVSAPSTTERSTRTFQVRAGRFAIRSRGPRW